FGRRDAFERQIGQAFEVRVRRRERLADEVDRRHANELDVRMEEKAADELAAAVTAAADDGGLEALRHDAREPSSARLQVPSFARAAPRLQLCGMRVPMI